MRVVMDVTSLCSPRPTGVGVYVQHLFNALTSRLDLDLRGTWSFTRMRGGRHRNLPPDILRLSSARWPVAAHLETLVSGALVHGPDFRVPRWSGVRRVVTVHDLAAFQPDYLPNDHARKLRRRIEGLAKNPPHAVIMPSYAMADEMAGRFPDLADRIHAVHHGCDHLPPAATNCPATDPPYFLFVGNVERRKNVSGLVRSFELLAARIPDVRLVIVGKSGHGGGEIARKIAGSPVNDRIDQRAWLSPQQLPDIYAGACGLVFPTWYEGFGFPILEAMWHGCPVITSKGGAMGEVADQAAMLVDPGADEEIAAAMEHLLEDRLLRQDLVERGRVHAHTFTWDSCAEATAAVYGAAMDA